MYGISVWPGGYLLPRSVRGHVGKNVTLFSYMVMQHAAHLEIYPLWTWPRGWLVQDRTAAQQGIYLCCLYGLVGVTEPWLPVHWTDRESLDRFPATSNDIFVRPERWTLPVDDQVSTLCIRPSRTLFLIILWQIFRAKRKYSRIRNQLLLVSSNWNLSNWRYIPSSLTFTRKSSESSIYGITCRMI